MINFELDSIGNRVSMGLTDRRKTVEISAIGGELLIDRYNSIVVTMRSRSSFFNG